ncbi:unnamed protein product [Paramecium primaurelia]|uniref:Uncharacterized protein n=1 Tax=Paramecium primaurelia TaxID=5886 RepID=A0A8S1PLC1_PARPR|nr:unnamed protein product [Paramecium primaurelia]
MLRLYRGYLDLNIGKNVFGILHLINVLIEHVVMLIQHIILTLNVQKLEIAQLNEVKMDCFFRLQSS